MQASVQRAVFQMPFANLIRISWLGFLVKVIYSHTQAEVLFAA
jgi:hypothetical protein